MKRSLKCTVQLLSGYLETIIVYNLTPLNQSVQSSQGSEIMSGFKFNTVTDKRKNRSWTIIKFKHTDVVIKAILVLICPISFIKDLRSKMHQFKHRFLKIFPGVMPLTSLLGGETPSPNTTPHRRLRRLGSPPSAAHAWRLRPSHFQNHSDAHEAYYIAHWHGLR